MTRVRHSDLADTIRATAWEQIAAIGVGGLSLRAIARDLGITAPAIYNYYPRRDDLITALIVEAYTSFGDSQVSAYDSASPDDRGARMTALALAYRDWAVEHPHRYQLIFGTPVPNYHPPADLIAPCAARSISALVRAIEDLHQAGLLRTDNLPTITPGHEGEAAHWIGLAGGRDTTVLAAVQGIWSRVHGLVSLEIAGMLFPFGPSGDALYRHALAELCHQYLKEPLP